MPSKYPLQKLLKDIRQVRWLRGWMTERPRNEGDLIMARPNMWRHRLLILWSLISPVGYLAPSPIDRQSRAQTLQFAFDPAHGLTMARNILD